MPGEHDLDTLTALGSDLREYAAACDSLALVDCSDLRLLTRWRSARWSSYVTSSSEAASDFASSTVDEFHRRVFEIVGLAELLDDNIT